MDFMDSGLPPMQDVDFPPAMATIAARRTVTPEDVARMRATVYGNAIVSRQEAEWAFALEETATETCEEWTTFFVEAVVDYVVRQEHPAKPRLSGNRGLADCRHLAGWRRRQRR